MNVKKPLLIAALGCVLASCTLTKSQSQLYREDSLKRVAAQVFDVAAMARDTSAVADHYILENADIYFSSEFEGAPYMSLEGYAKLLSNYFLPGCNYQVQNALSMSSLLLTNENGDPVYQLIVDYPKSKFTYAGSASAVIKSLVDYSETSLTLRANIDTSIAAVYETGAVESFAGGNLPIYRNNRIFYLPLALWEARIGCDAGVSHFYDGSGRLYRYGEIAQLTAEYSIGYAKFHPIDEWSSYYTNHGEMPKGMALADADVFYFKMRNEYGLKERKMGGTDFATYYQQKNIDDGSQIGSQNPITHAQALLNALNVLDDDHTGVSSVAPWWGQNASTVTSQRGPESVARKQTLKTLSAKRKEILDAEGKTMKDVRVSPDQSLAVITFDSFDFAQKAFVSGTTELIPNIAEQDTYFYLMQQFETVKQTGSIRNVVIDISTNGGGVVGVMYKILAYLSANNSATAYLKQGSTTILEMTTQVDSNDDGRYTREDSIGSSYNLFLLTSSCSFSCGNALPFFAKKQNIAKIIGQRSGGGECSVSKISLPSGIECLYSSSNHIGWFDNTFEGDEDGVEPDIPLTFDEYYDLQTLQTKLAN